MSDIESTVNEVLRLDGEATKAPWAPRYYTAKDMTDLRAIVADLVNDGVGVRFHFVSDHADSDRITGASGNGPTSEANAALIAYYRTAAPQLAREVQRLTAERDDAREMTHAALDDIGAPGDRSVPPWERIGRIAPLGQEPTT